MRGRNDEVLLDRHFGARHDVRVIAVAVLEADDRVSTAVRRQVCKVVGGPIHGGEGLLSFFALCVEWFEILDVLGVSVPPKDADVLVPDVLVRPTHCDSSAVPLVACLNYRTRSKKPGLIHALTRRRGRRRWEHAEIGSRGTRSTRLAIVCGDDPVVRLARTPWVRVRNGAGRVVHVARSVTPVHRDRTRAAPRKRPLRLDRSRGCDHLVCEQVEFQPDCLASWSRRRRACRGLE